MFTLASLATPSLSDIPLRGRRSRRLDLARGTALGGGLAMVMLFAGVSPSLAQDQCGAPTGGEIICDANGGPYDGGIQYRVETGDPVQDLTVRFPDPVSVSSTAEFAPGVSLFNGSGGDVTISGSGDVSISTTGANAAGAKGIATDGAVTIVVGDVTTTGDRSEGVYGSTNYTADGGDVTISTGAVSTSGTAATGVRATTYQADIAISATSVTTTGFGADAIYAAANYGSAAITVGEVRTSGEGGRGIVVYAHGTARVNAVSVTTTGASDGDDLAGRGVLAVGTGVYVDISGDVSTSGDFATAITARTNVVNPDLDSYDRQIRVSAGDISTAGASAYGVFAANYFRYGNVEVSVGNVTTLGDNGVGLVGLAAGGAVTITGGNISTAGARAFGVYANALAGDARVTLGDVTTTGYFGAGVIVRSVTGDAVVTVGDIETTGDGAIGLYAAASAQSGTATLTVGDVTTHGFGSTAITGAGASVEITLTGDVTTLATGPGAAAQGIQAFSSAGDVVIHTSGAVSTRTDRGYALLLGSQGGDIIVDGAGSVFTTGDYASGIAAVAQRGSIAINVDQIAVSGFSSNGIQATSFGSRNDDITITGNSITTTGEGYGKYSPGVSAVWAINLSEGGDIAIDVGAVSTLGQNGRGVLAASYGATAIRVGTVSTAGIGATGVDAQGVSTLVEALRTETLGDLADGIRVVARGGAAIVHAGTVSTTGAVSAGVRVSGDKGVSVSADQIVTHGLVAAGVAAYASGGDIAISTGRIRTSGETALGILATNTGGSITVESSDIATTGAGAGGIYAAVLSDDALSLTGDILIRAGAVSTSGAGAFATGVTALNQGAGAITVQTSGPVMAAGADALGVLASGTGRTRVEVGGRVESGAATAIAARGATVDIAIAATGVVSGGLNGVEAITAASGSGFGAIRIINAGALSARGFAILTQDGATTIDNTGSIVGALRLSDQDDRLNNAGRFEAARDSDFGLGQDLFVNSGVLQAGRGAVALRGLERLENAGGLVDLRNGGAGDVFTLAGAYIGSGDARLGLDVAGGITDRLVVTGAATGQTQVLLQGLTPANAMLSLSPLVVVDAGAGSAADSFVVSTPDVGLIHYGLRYDAAANDYLLTAVAGSSVHGLLRLQDAGQAQWRDGADALRAHLAAGRDTAVADGRAVWVQAYTGEKRLDGQGAPLSPGDSQQQASGLQVGVDIASPVAAGATLTFGLTAGVSTTALRFKSSLQEADFEALNIGAYASAARGPWFASAIVKYDIQQVSVRDQTAGYDASLDGQAWGVQGEIGRRFGGAGLAIEPILGFSFVHSDLDDFASQANRVAFDAMDGGQVRAGVRISSAQDLGGVGGLSLFGTAEIVRQVSGEEALVLHSGGTSERLGASAEGTFGRLQAGLRHTTARGVTASIEMLGEWGDDRDGVALRVGGALPF